MTRNLGYEVLACIRALVPRRKVFFGKQDFCMVLNGQGDQEVKEDWEVKCQDIGIMGLVRKGETDSGQKQERRVDFRSVQVSKAIDQDKAQN